MSKLIKENYTNKLGQVIKPGDEVIYVGSSYSYTSIKKATYIGYYMNDYSKRKQVALKKKTSGSPWERELVRLELNRVYKLDEMSKEDVLNSALVHRS